MYERSSINFLELSGREKNKRYRKGDFEVNISNLIEKVQNNYKPRHFLGGKTSSR
jgi:hypothetical protein